MHASGQYFPVQHALSFLLGLAVGTLTGLEQALAKSNAEMEAFRKAAADAGAGVKTLTPQLKPLQEAAKKAAEQKAAADKVAAEEAAAAKVADDGAAAARQAAQRAAADKAEFDKSNNAQASAAK